MSSSSHQTTTTSATSTVAANREKERNNDRIDYLCVLDFEATCNERRPAPRPQEIIEFPTLLQNTRTGEVESTFHHYIRPNVHPTLSDFCTQLTGIQQEQIDQGISLQEALKMHRQWLEENGIVSFAAAAATASKEETDEKRRPTFVYLTCGDWDLNLCLPKELSHHGKVPPVEFTKWINIKRAFSNFYKLKGRPGGMKFMLNHLGLELEGRHHSGIDDCKNIARIVAVMLQDGWKPCVKNVDSIF